MTTHKTAWFGDRAVVIDVASPLDRELVATIVMRALPEAVVRRGISSLMVELPRPNINLVADVRRVLASVDESREASEPSEAPAADATISIDVAYDGPDLLPTATFFGISDTELVQAHTSQRWRVAASREVTRSHAKSREVTRSHHPKSRKVMQQLRLRHMNELVFLSVSPATMSMVRTVDPFVAYGYPTLKTVRDLIYKRGHGKVDKQRLPLTDNSLIEAQLGEHGIICMEDLVHEIFSVGPAFKEANNFLWPFKSRG